jgi:hypothetical protein
MSSAALIPLQVQSPQAISPLQSVASLMQIRDSLSQIALRNQQVQQAAAETQNQQVQAAQKNRDLADQNLVSEKLKDPELARRVYGGDFSPLHTLGLQPKTVDSVSSSIQALIDKEATHDTTVQAQRGTAAAKLGDDLGALKDTFRNSDGSVDMGKVNAVWPGFVAAHTDDLKHFGLAPTDLPVSLQDEDHLNSFATRVEAFKGMNSAAQDLAAKRADIAQKGAETGKAGAETDKAKAETTHQNLLNAMLQNPEAGLTAIDKLAAPGSALNVGMKASYSAAQTPEARQAVLEKGLSQLGEKDPELITARVNQAVRTAQGELPVRQAEAGYQNALQQGDKASGDYFSSLKDAKQAVATANTIQQVIDLSKQTGNPVAMQQLKAMVPEFTNAAQQIKRTSGGQNAGLSSSLDNAINELTSAGGKPLSDATIAAITPYVKTIANGAVQQHNANVEALSKTYPQKQFAPEPVPYGHVGGHFVGESVRLKNGNTVKITKILPNDQFEYE